MSRTNRVRSGLLAAALVLLPGAAAGQLTGASNSPDMAPVNDLPNPYQAIDGWAKMPTGRTWGSTSAVGIDRDGVSVWVGERCGANSCRDSDLDVVLKFDANGNLVTSFGSGTAIFPHGFHVDREGNIWLTDGQDNRPRQQQGAAADAPPPPPPAEIRGHQVYKFSPTGQLLMTLGVKGGVPTAAEREAGQYFYQPNAVLVAPNGDIFVSEGHSSGAGAAARVLKFDSRGNFIKAWGSLGSGQGQFNQPHALAMDSQGRLFVGDRGNNRIQIFDQEGNFLDMWYQFSRPSGVYIDANDVLYVADSESGTINPAHGTWTRGIRIGSARDGRVTGFIPDQAPVNGTSSAEGVAADRNGVIYGAEVGQRTLRRYTRP